MESADSRDVVLYLLAGDHAAGGRSLLGEEYRVVDALGVEQTAQTHGIGECVRFLDYVRIDRAYVVDRALSPNPWIERVHVHVGHGVAMRGGRGTCGAQFIVRCLRHLRSPVSDIRRSVAAGGGPLRQS